ncbi:phage tail sheath C-terminal domain-containing protein [uncultured Aquimarina sp.]|uniref:phage tail sheath family protein n=1 Tax=uncultured Aquimarina sp. TaxID=575652 RepID=UPI0026183AFF|nr:phage tail sheath C-terminal domain-containing protein [uncultured Aquimarina sp.]
MADYKTPGVYIEEINTLPASVAPVATAVPAFVGYTEKAIVDNETIDPSTSRIPVRITSMLDFIDHFGGPFQEYYDVAVSDPGTGESDAAINVSSIGTSQTPYHLYYQIRMFYANGGGTCYVVSVGTYSDIDETDATTIQADIDSISIDHSALQAGLNACEEIDEITILTIPEAMEVSDGNRKTLYDAMLIQCDKLQDRFAVFDVEADITSTVFDDGNDFRNDNIGPDYLKYGAAYYPSLETQIEFSFSDRSVLISDTTTGANGAIWNDQGLGAIHTGQTSTEVDIPFVASATIIIETVNISDGDTFLIGPETLTVVAAPGNPNEFSAGATNNDSAENLRVAINALGSTGVTATIDNNILTLSAIADGAAGNGIPLQYTAVGANIGAVVSGSELSGGVDRYIDTNLYNRIIKELKKHKVTLYPCGAIAGIYASVDRDRGVWKAPANVSVNLVNEPSIAITTEEQANLNVDATTGKSINAIRLFSGKGTIIWGARTLAGNDNEWRYVPVRRFYNFMEESIKKATEFVIFEPNSKPTWVRTKAMIENFLTGLWREGALAGAKPEHAFFVKIGLGETMTAIDILEGRMNIEIGVAAVRPAEFIILKFSHKLQES